MATRTPHGVEADNEQPVKQGILFLTARGTRRGLNWSEIQRRRTIMAQISMDNGLTFHGPEELSELPLGEYWDALCEVMDEGVAGQVHNELAPCSEEEFLRRYLELAKDDLMLG